MSIAFIGLGIMGLPMANRLMQSGCNVRGWDFSPQACAHFSNPAESLESAIENADTVVTMLPEGKDVGGVYDAILADSSVQNRLFIDCSTIAVETAQELAQKVTTNGDQFIDAPVSGGAEGAAAGTLSFMVGGEAAAIERARPLLQTMGAKLAEFGGAGSGQAAKACHNMICGITVLGVCEAFALAESLQLDATQFFELCKGAAAQSWILENRCPVPGPAPAAPSSNDYVPGFSARLMAKDLRLAQSAAQACRQKTPFGAQAAALFAEFAEAENGDLDFSAIYESIKRKKI